MFFLFIIKETSGEMVAVSQESSLHSRNPKLQGNNPIIYPDSTDYMIQENDKYPYISFLSLEK